MGPGPARRGRLSGDASEGGTEAQPLSGAGASDAGWSSGAARESAGSGTRSAYRAEDGSGKCGSASHAGQNPEPASGRRGSYRDAAGGGTCAAARGLAGRTRNHPGTAQSVSRGGGRVQRGAEDQPESGERTLSSRRGAIPATTA